MMVSCEMMGCEMDEMVDYEMVSCTRDEMTWQNGGELSVSQSTISL